MNDLVKNETGTAVAIPQAAAPKETFLASDMIIPRILLMQGLSEFVQDRKAQVGDIVKSTTIEKVGDDKTPIGIIPLTYNLKWQLHKVEKDGSLKHIGYEPRTVDNENDPWTYEQDGEQRKRTKVVNLFAFLSNDLGQSQGAIAEGELPDLDKVLLPVMITFRSSGYKAGQVAINHFMKVYKIATEKSLDLKPFQYELTLECKEEENDKGRFFVFNMSQSAKPAKKEYIAECQNWYNLLTHSLDSIKVDSDPEESSEEKPVAQPTTKF